MNFPQRDVEGLPDFKRSRSEQLAILELQRVPVPAIGGRRLL